MNVRVHTSDGTVEFERGSVSSATEKTAFLASPLGRGAAVVVENAPYATYRIAPEAGVGATLQFNGEQLQNLSCAFAMPGEDEGDWSEELEMRRKKTHEEWLLREFGNPPYRFDWGEIDCEFDAKGVSSAIIVTYGK
jgi:hypothetical protein